jgi:ABC-type branched-subunit amino acid transport system ATPase component
MLDPLLRLRGISKHFGPVQALTEIDLDIPAGQVTALVGDNGAGKTTLIDAITGYTRATGSVELLGTKLDALKPYQRSRDGLGRTFQGIELYDDLSVRENVEVGTTAARFSRGDGGAPPGDVDTYFKVLDLESVADQPVQQLSVGQRQLVSIARALAGRPTIVLLDEPAAGLDVSESRWLAERLRAIRDTGTTVVMVDHDMGLVLAVCDRIVVLNLGKVIAVGTPQEIERNDEVKRAYLGTTHAGVEAAS